MIITHFKISLRSLKRNKQYALINIAGLAMGIAIFLFIIEYVASEWNVNRFHKNFNELYRMNGLYKDGTTSYTLPPGIAPRIKQNVAGIKEFVRVSNDVGSGVVSLPGNKPNEAKVFREADIAYVDNNFFKVFSFPLIVGAPELQSNTLALSEKISNKLFGNINSIGKTVLLSNQFGNTLYTVNAVFKDMDDQTDIKGQVLLSLQTLESEANRDGNDWADPNGIQSGYVNIYWLLESKADPNIVAKQIAAYIHSADPHSVEDKTYLQPFKHLHFAPSFSYPYQTFGSLLLATVFAGVALLILVIGWVNYINLSTAQALTRAKEVGVRKVLGAKRSQLITQYLAETFIITIVSALIALLVVKIFQRLVNGFVLKQLSLQVLNNGWFWLDGILLIIVGSLLSGSYVAFVISSYKPVKAFSTHAQSAGKSFSLRKGLVVFQFTISIVFIIATIVLYKQLNYMSNESLGMNLAELLVIKGPTVSSEGQAAKNAAFKNELSRLPFVKKYAASNNIPGQGFNFSTEKITKTNPQKGDERKSYSMFIADENFFDTYGITFKEGTGFTNNDAERSWNNVKKVVINIRAAEVLGFDTKKSIVGENIVWDDKSYEVIGVVNDYHHLSLKEPIRPAIYLASVSFVYFTVKTDKRNLPSKINALKNLYSKYFSSNPFEFFFADETFNKQYIAEQKLGKVFITTACVAIFIACIGLFGLASYSAKTRIKEIGIRKVLGASVKDIATLLSKDFLKLVFTAIIIASPLAWYIIHKWLEDFAYRTNISWWIFIAAGCIAIAIALLTVSFQAIKAAIANPVKNLRTE